MIAELPWNTQSDWPILAVLQLLPLAAAGMSATLRQERWLFPLALLLAGLELIAAVTLYRLFDPGQSAFQLAEHFPLLGPLAYHAAADGMTVLFILLTAFLVLMAVLYGKIRPFQPLSHFLTALFLCQGALISQLATLDLLWFFLFSVVQMGLAGYLMHTWSTSPEEGESFTRFIQFMGIGLFLLLLGTLLLGWSHAGAHQGRWRFDLLLLAATPIPGHFQTAIFFLLFYGLAIRIPLFPLHGWLPPAAEHGAVAPALVLLLGIKSGVYGLLRFVFPLLPQAVAEWQTIAIAFATAGIFYAALLAMMQQNLRRMIAYAVVSHTSIVMIGLFSLHPLAFQGGILLTFNFGLATATLIYMVGLIHRRTHTVLLNRLGGLFDRLPLIGIAFFIAGLAIVGMPGTPGFDAVHLVLEAAIHRFGTLVTMAAALGNVASAGFLLWAFQRTFLAQPEGHAATATPVSRAEPLENLLAAALILVQLSAGFFSEPWMRLVEPTAHTLAAPYLHPVAPSGAVP